WEVRAQGSPVHGARHSARRQPRRRQPGHRRAWPHGVPRDERRRVGRRPRPPAERHRDAATDGGGGACPGPGGILGRGRCSTARRDLPERSRVTSFLDGVVAAALALIPHLYVVSRVRAAFPRDEGAFLARVYLWTLALRYCGALFLNAYSGDSAFADAYWGDSSTYDLGGYMTAMRWSGESFSTPLTQTTVSGYGFM